MPKEIEIIPPLRMPETKPQRASVSVSVPGARSYGTLDGIEAYFDKRRYVRTGLVTDKLTDLNRKEAALFSSQSAATTEYIKRQEELFRLQDLPERLGHEQTVRRIVRFDQLCEVRHTHELNQQRRRKDYMLGETEVVQTKAKLTHARTVLLDAQQQYEAQAKYGGTTHELHHKKQIVELLQIELEAEERRALLRSHNVDLGDDDRGQRELAEETSEQFEQELREELDKMLAKS